MLHTLNHRLRRLAGRALQAVRALHPRAIAWRRLQKSRPRDPVITPLVGGLKVRVYPTDVIGRDIYVYGQFEPREVRLVRRLLKPGMTLLDIGANLGQYTLLGAAAVGPAGRVHSFEPSSRMFGELEFNVRLNHLEGVCVLNRAAVSDAKGTARLSVYAPGQEVYGSLGSRQWEGAQQIGHEDVPTITLDDYVREQGIAHVDLIKMDIEGAELPALRGARELLSRPDAPAIVVELADVNTEGFGYKAIEIWAFLESLGYAFHGFDARGCVLGRQERPEGPLNAPHVVATKNAAALGAS